MRCRVKNNSSVAALAIQDGSHVTRLVNTSFLKSPMSCFAYAL